MAIHLETLGLLAKAPVEGDLEQAAVAFEAYFLRHILAEVRGSQESSLLDGGPGGRMFREMLDEALADAMAEGGGIGLAEVLGKQLENQVDARAVSAEGGADLERGRKSDAHRAYRAAAVGPGVFAALPVEGEITSEFGRRSDPLAGHPDFHAGIDLAAAQGTAVRAAGSGVVVRAAPAGSYGNLVVVDHGGGLETRYAHLDRVSVQVGDRVEPGAAIGTVGATGRTTGPHLHFEVRRDGRPQDPRNEISRLKNWRSQPNP
jgi:murein DD-endopeptidase MepM/ murein hydrolase activator NlpD